MLDFDDDGRLDLFFTNGAQLIDPMPKGAMPDKSDSRYWRNPQPGETGFPPGCAILTLLFDGNSVNRLEWILRSDGIFEAWQSFDGKLERFDNGKLATKEKNPRLGIGRRGEQVFFMLNREVGLERTIRGLSSNFKVMLYGYGSSENNWDEIYVQTPKQ